MVIGLIQLMPIYEYECKDCGHRMDALQKISEPALVRCPACQQDSLRKLVSAPQFRLKGSGWYETDFKNDKRRNIAGEGEKQNAGGKAEAADKKVSETGQGNTGASQVASDNKAAPTNKIAAKPEKNADK